MEREELMRVLDASLAEMRAARDRVVEAEARLGCAFETVEDEADRQWFAERVLAAIEALTAETRRWAVGRLIAMVPSKGVH